MRKRSRPLSWIGQNGPVPKLIDPLSDDALRMLTVIAEGWAGNDEQWPIWQYVMLRLDEEGLKAEEIFMGLPTWNYSYRPVYSPNSGLPPAPGEPIALTVHGMVHVDHPATNQLLAMFLHVLRSAEKMQRTAIPNARDLVDMIHTVADLMHMDIPPTRPPAPTMVGEVLRHEPSTWSGLVSSDDVIPHWDLSRSRLRPYGGVPDGREYLARLEELVGINEFAASQQRELSPTALPEAFDHLDLAWQLVFNKKHLLNIPRASLIAHLTQPVNSVAEYQTQCTALADLINCLKVPLPAGANSQEPGGSLVRLQALLREQLGDDADSAILAVRQLHHVVGLRNGQQHSGSATRVDGDRAALGLIRYGSDWAGAWDRVRVVTVDALTTIRESLSTLLD
jgi:hypothetical protein